jgi:diketogulonate reductase-like aldo/keto reductase
VRARRLVALPTSTQRERIEGTAQVFVFSLFEQDVAALDALDGTGGTDQAREQVVVTTARAQDRLHAGA